MSDLKRVAFTNLTSAGSIESISRKVPSTTETAATFLQQSHEVALSSATQTTLLPPSGAAASSSSVSMTSRNQDLPSKTFRLELELFEPNANSFPEFNFKKLAHKQFKQSAKVNGLSLGFGDDDDDDDVHRIAKELEKKYGNFYEKDNKNRKVKYADCYDKGAGYDESDSFIDNTEAYDEIIPEEVETVGGGFYINSGALEFKHLSNYEDSLKVNKIKKRVLSTSSSSENENSSKKIEKDIEKKQYNKEKLPSNVAAINQKSGHVDKKQKTENIEKESFPGKTKDSKLDKIKIKEDNVPIDLGKEKDKAIKTTTVKDMLMAKRDNFRKMQGDKKKNKLTNGDSKKTRDSSEECSGSSSEENNSNNEEPEEKKTKKIEEENFEKIRSNEIKMPEHLPEKLLENIQEFRSKAELMSQNGKTFHFDDELGNLFLGIDDVCCSLDKTIRSQIYGHLEYQLGLSKCYLLRKAKALQVKREKTKTKKAFMKLKKAVAELMPSILLAYEAQYRKVEDTRSKISQSDLEKIENPPKFPRKKFPWNDILRNLLYELYQIRWTSFSVLRTRKENFDEFVSNYLKEKVVSIWPSGWMKVEDLKRELDKRKTSAKKTKEKKYNENPQSTKGKIKELEGKNEKQTSNKSEYLKSYNTTSTASIVSTKDLVVTITTKPDKNLDTIIHSPKCSSLSVTPIKLDNATHNKYTTHKAESNITSTLPQKLEVLNFSNKQNIVQNNNLLSPTCQNVTNQKSSNQNSNNSNISNKNSRIPNEITITNSQNKSNSSADLTSPSKKSTDHSIETIMSSNTQILQHSTSSYSPNSLETNKSINICNSSNRLEDNSTTHIITVDNLKCASDIIQTSHQLLNGNNNLLKTPGNNNNINNTNKECAIRVRSIVSLNNSEKDNNKKDAIIISNKKSRQIASYKSESDSSSESDGVEIVGVYPNPKKKTNNLKINTNKYNKKSDSASRSITPPINITAQNLIKSSNKKPFSKDDIEKNVENQKICINEAKDTDLDYNQIMKALKELEQPFSSLEFFGNTAV